MIVDLEAQQQTKFVLTLTYEPGRGFSVVSTPPNLDAVVAQGMIRHADAHYDMVVRSQFQAAMQQQNRLVRANSFPPPSGVSG